MAQRDFANAQKQIQLAMAADPESDTAFRGLAHLRSVASRPQLTADQIAQTSAAQIAPPSATTPQSPPCVNLPPVPGMQFTGQPPTPQERLASVPSGPRSEIRIVDHTEAVESIRR